MVKEQTIRTRFAPSPTGDLHIGGARTALFNYLLSKRMDGEFLLRIEDTDQARSTNEAVETIIAGMTWLGMESDQEPIFQSRRMEIYRDSALKLLKAGLAYPCFCSSEELEQMREEARAKGNKPAYNRKHRQETGSLLPSGKELDNNERPFVIRIKSPTSGTTIFKDLVVGEIETPNEEIDDFIIIRSDGSPTYNFTVVVDDIDMEITHVVRGVDHISNTPKQLVVYNALEAKLPVFAHVPMILGEDKKKLSKRHGATSVFEYKKEGYLPEAFKNYLARLGWSHGDQEIFSSEELYSFFDINKVNKSDSVFDFEKLRWVNSEHLKNKPTEEITPLVNEILKDQFSLEFSDSDTAKLAHFIDIEKSRSKTILEIAEAACFIPQAPKIDLENKKNKKIFKQESAIVFKDFVEQLKTLGEIDEQSIEQLIESTVAKHEVGFGKLGQPLRMALSGTAGGLPIPQLVGILGHEESLKRLNQSIELFEA